MEKHRRRNGIIMPPAGYANETGCRLFFDTINNMTVKDWIDSEENRVFIRHVVVWMNYCANPIPPLEHN
jgi:antibiotic biosynthesis monooxygenase (ABM) superfamily enzyme